MVSHSPSSSCGPLGRCPVGTSFYKQMHDVVPSEVLHPSLYSAFRSRTSLVFLLNDPVD